METKHWIVKGTVQGVCFRAATVEVAHHLDLVGWVRNLSNGDVEVLAQGNLAAIAQLDTWLHQGPPAARVKEVISSLVPAQELSSFEKIRSASAPEFFGCM